eukprot:Platyproteum_vivax@DN7605_c1_g1_i18.p1
MHIVFRNCLYEIEIELIVISTRLSKVISNVYHSGTNISLNLIRVCLHIKHLVSVYSIPCPNVGSDLVASTFSFKRKQLVSINFICVYLQVNITTLLAVQFITQPDYPTTGCQFATHTDSPINLPK